MRVALLGATGFVGRHVLAAARNRGHDLSLLVREPARLGSDGHPFSIIRGDYFEREPLRAVLDGVGAVISTIGPPTKRGLGGRDPRDYARGMQALIEAMKDAGVARIVHLSGATPRLEGETLSPGPRMLRLALALALPGFVEAKERELRVLESSDLAWTSFRPPLIVRKSAGTLVVDPGRPERLARRRRTARGAASRRRQRRGVVRSRTIRRNTEAVTR